MTPSNALALALAKRYTSTWQQTAKAEPRSTSTDNAGRRAANQYLRERREQ
jgi:hypothetical protein